MKDLDFDELDRAVNSLMKGAPKTQPEPGLSEEQTVTITPTVSDGAKPSLATLNQAVANLNGSAEPSPVLDVPVPTSVATPAVSVPTATAAPAPTPASSPSVAARRGKFMDMVRPGASTPTTPTRQPSRQGISLDPGRPVVNDILAPTSPPPATTPAASSAKADDGQSSVDPLPQAAESTNEESAWPDPMDMVDYEPSEKKTTTQDAPLVSPFLPDAKVEKRPLGSMGATADESKAESPITDEPPVDDSTTSAQLPASPAEVIAKPLPAELANDVVALDSDANTTSSAEATESTESLKDTSGSSVTETPAAVESNLSQPAAPVIPAGPISIPQQYKEEPNSGDKENGSIYDTDTYHKPLSHPAKKKSGWMWVVWIILILVLGAGIGAGLYLLGVF